MTPSEFAHTYYFEATAGFEQKDARAIARAFIPTWEIALHDAPRGASIG